MRALLASFLLFVATPTWAEWVKVAETMDASFYVDPATISKDGNLRRIWELRDYVKPEPSGTRSRRRWIEIDCTGDRVRVRSVVEHSQPMGEGTILGSVERESDWNAVELTPRTGSNIPPRTPDAMIFRFVCSR